MQSSIISSSTSAMQSPPSPYENHNRILIGEALSLYLALLHQAKVMPGQPSPFPAAFPLADAMIMPRRSLLTRHNQLAVDFRIVFRERNGAMRWRIEFDRTVFACFVIPAATLDGLRHWSPSAAFVLNCLLSALHQAPIAPPMLELTQTQFLASDLGHHPAQELALCNAAGVVVVGAVLYRCITKRCHRVYSPGGVCRMQHV
ncbi:SCP domain-containing protein [Mycena kentingensis (nom. inval.)]|nr:SCP domain-containing protein [Mycena kentingensis (nom. inval.)]